MVDLKDIPDELIDALLADSTKSLMIFSEKTAFWSN
jgi:hypothetical protein